jgi:hypothetical protein
MQHLTQARARGTAQAVAPPRATLLDQPGHLQRLAHEAVGPRLRVPDILTTSFPETLTT